MLSHKKHINLIDLVDLAITLDLISTLVRLCLHDFNEKQVQELNAHLDIIKYRSHQAINDTYGGKYEGCK